MIDNLILIILLLILYYFSYIKLKLLLITFYIIIQILIYILPYLLTTYIYHDSDMVHPLHGSDLLPYYTKSFIYILCFDILLFSTIFLLIKIKPIFFTKTLSFKNFNLNINSYEIRLIYFSIFLLVLVIDFILLQNGSSSLTKYQFDNILFEPGSIPSSFIQPLKTISIIKYPFFIFLIFLNRKSNLGMNLYIYLFFIYLVFSGLIIGSRYFVVLPFILALYCYKNFLIKNLTKTIFISLFCILILPSLFPIIHTLRGDMMSFTPYSEPIDNSGKTYNTSEPFTKIKYLIQSRLYQQELKGNTGLKKYFFLFFDNTANISLKRLNYFHINYKIISHKEKNNKLNHNYYFNNFVSIIPRLVWPNKPIITNKSDIIAFEIGIFPKNIKKDEIFAVGFRPIGESFLVFGWKGILFGIVVGIFFYGVCFILSRNAIGYPFLIYYSFELIKHDTFHAVLPGFIHLLIGLIIFKILILTSKIINKKLYYN